VIKSRTNPLTFSNYCQYVIIRKCFFFLSIYSDRSPWPRKKGRNRRVLRKEFEKRQIISYRAKLKTGCWALFLLKALVDRLRKVSDQEDFGIDMTWAYHVSHN